MTHILKSWLGGGEAQSPPTDSGLNEGKTDSGLNEGKTDSGLNEGKTDSGLNEGKTDSGLNEGKTDSGLNGGEDSGVKGGETDPGLTGGETQSPQVNSGLNRGEAGSPHVNPGLNEGETESPQVNSGLNGGETDSGLNGGETDSGLNEEEKDSGLYGGETASGMEGGETESPQVNSGLNGETDRGFTGGETESPHVDSGLNVGETESPQVKSGLNGGDTESLYAPEDSSQSQGIQSGSTDAQGGGEPRYDDGNDNGEGQLGREAPSSQVGYGGGGGVFDDKTPEAQRDTDIPELNDDSRSHGGGALDGGGEEDLGGQQSDGTAAMNPSEAGFGNSGPGSYPEEHQQPPHQDYGGLPHPTRPEGAVLLSESQTPGPKYESENSPRTTTGNYEVKAPQTSGYGGNSEVRDGVPHRVLSEGVPSGAGVSNDAGNPTGNAEQREYHQTEAPSTQNDSPYSQQYTEPSQNAVNGGGQAQQDEGMVGNTEGGTHVEQQDKGLTAKVKQILSGHKHQGTVGDTEQGPGAADGESHEKEGFISKLKHKIHAHKHKDEISPTAYE